MTQTDTYPEAPREAGITARSPSLAEAGARTLAIMMSPEAEAWSRQATLDHYLASVRHAEAQFRATCWNLLVRLASDHSGEKTEVIVARWGYPSVYGELEHDGLSYRIGIEPGTVHRFTDAQVTSVTEANGYITLNIS